MARDLERQVAMGARLKELRESRPDLTQQKIAESIGITVRGYQFYEAGDTGIDHDRVEKLADLFGVSTKYLYDGVEEEPVVDPAQLDRIEGMLRELLEIARRQSGGDPTRLDEALRDLPGSGTPRAGRPAAAAPPARHRRSA